MGSKIPLIKTDTYEKIGKGLNLTLFQWQSDIFRDTQFRGHQLFFSQEFFKNSYDISSTYSKLSTFSFGKSRWLIKSSRYSSTGHKYWNSGRKSRWRHLICCSIFLLFYRNCEYQAECLQAERQFIGTVPYWCWIWRSGIYLLSWNGHSLSQAKI